MSEYQLRIYQIAPDRMAEFIAGWRNFVVPSREEFGFKVMGAWIETSASEFVWLVRWDGPDGYAAADREYYASPIRRALSWDPVPLITRHELRILSAVAPR